MKKEIYTSLLIVALFALIISIGCGGGNDGITQPSAIDNTDPANSDINQSTGYGSIHIKIVWPETGGEGSIAENENNLIGANIPYDTTKIIIEFLEQQDAPDATENPVHEPVEVKRNAGWGEAEVTVDKIPVGKIIIRTTAYNSTEPDTPLETVDTEYVIFVGIQRVYIMLYNYSIKMEALSPIEISPTPTTPLTLLEEETEITATLAIDPPGDVIFPKPDKLITFTVEPYTGEGVLIDPVSGAEGDTIDVITDSDGKCNVKFKGETLGFAIIRATFLADPGVSSSSITVAFNINIGEYVLDVSFANKYRYTYTNNGYTTSLPTGDLIYFWGSDGKLEFDLKAHLRINTPTKSFPLADKPIYFEYIDTTGFPAPPEYYTNVSPYPDSLGISLTNSIGMTPEEDGITNVNGDVSGIYTVNWSSSPYLNKHIPGARVWIGATYTDDNDNNVYTGKAYVDFDPQPFLNNGELN